MKDKVSKSDKSRSPGYSGTPLHQKLGLDGDSCVLLVGAPADYRELVGSAASGAVYKTRPSQAIDIAHVFVTRKQDLARHLQVLRQRLRPDAVVWISWPKKAAKMQTDVTEDTIRQVALPLGYVDIKVCAVTEIWSGLKLAVRKELR